MFDEQWQFAVEVERKYNQYRKKVMVRYDLSAAEVDVLLFLANNSHCKSVVEYEWNLCKSKHERKIKYWKSLFFITFSVLIVECIYRIVQ